MGWHQTANKTCNSKSIPSFSFANAACLTAHELPLVAHEPSPRASPSPKKLLATRCRLRIPSDTDAASYLLHQFLAHGDDFGFHALLCVSSSPRVIGLTEAGEVVAGAGVRDDGCVIHLSLWLSLICRSKLNECEAGLTEWISLEILMTLNCWICHLHMDNVEVSGPP